MLRNARTLQAALVQEWAIQHGIKLVFTKPYLHHNNGLVERCIGTVFGRMRRIMVDQCGTKWLSLMDQVQRVVNNMVHHTTQETPFDLWYASRAIWKKQIEKQTNKKRHQVNNHFKTGTILWQLKLGILVYDLKRLQRTRAKCHLWWIPSYELIQEMSEHMWQVRHPKDHHFITHSDLFRLSS